MDSRKNRVTTGDISNASPTMSSFKWKVRDFFSLPEDVNYCVESLIFTFMDAEWQLQMYPNGQDGFEGWIGLYMIKVRSITKSHSVAYHLGIAKEDETEYISTKGEMEFEGNGAVCGSNKAIERSSLLNSKNRVLPQGTVTVFCRLRLTPSKNRQTASQTIPPVGFAKLQQDFQELLNEQDGDIVLRVKGKVFNVHKAILKARSSVFKSILSHTTRGCTSTDIVDITDCNPSAFQDFLYYLYCGTVEFCADKVFDLYFIAYRYHTTELKDMCIEFISDNISIDSFFNTLIFALMYNESAVLKYATIFFIENYVDITKTDTWSAFLKEKPTEVKELFCKIVENLSVDTFMDTMMFAIKFKEPMVLNHATRFFVENSTYIVNAYNNCKWLHFLNEMPEEANELLKLVLENKAVM